MNSTPEVVKAEMEYRLERARGGVHDRTTPEHLRAARASHPSWWRRLRVQHSSADNDAA